jgi:hypothetical protein
VLQLVLEAKPLVGKVEVLQPLERLRLDLAPAK